MNIILARAISCIVVGVLIITGVVNTLLSNLGLLESSSGTRRGENRVGFLTLITDTEASKIPYLIGVWIILFGVFLLYRYRKTAKKDI